ncbi:GNAT family N-acetyltransferase [Agreia bicolorata]|uniref:GNAT family N-acetyltransferase n=1 Tax=Agreia bicolorata TaxID=110935 RepID=UPI000696A82D|nr:GNAT family N-acetyltransferase [Agreia bicolorata]
MTTTNNSTPLTTALVDPRSADGRAVVTRFYTDVVGRYWGRTATAAEVEQAMLDEPSDDLRGEGGFLLLVQDGVRVVGCGGVRFIEPGVGELTRIFIDTAARGRGAGRTLIDELESISARRGVHTLRLTVRRDLVEAHRLYQRLGYETVEPFSTSPYADYHLAKKLPPSAE